MNSKDNKQLGLLFQNTLITVSSRYVESQRKEQHLRRNTFETPVPALERRGEQSGFGTKHRRQCERNSMLARSFFLVPLVTGESRLNAISNDRETGPIQLEKYPK